MKALNSIIVLIILISIVINLNVISTSAQSLSSYSFVYDFGNAKIWVYIEASDSLAIGPSNYSSILLTIYLEKLGTNKGVFLNRVTFNFEGTQLEKAISPNVTLSNDGGLWSDNISFEQNASAIVGPGQMMKGEMDFELRYDIIDSAENMWSYRINEKFPQTLLNTEQADQPLPAFVTVFAIVSLLGIGSATVLILFKIRRYRKAQLQAQPARLVLWRRR